MRLRLLMATLGLILTCAPHAFGQVRPIVVRPLAVAPPAGAIPITMPDGTTVGDATGHLLLFFSSDATAASQAAVRSAISAGGGQVVGELPGLQMLQVQVADPSAMAGLMTTLQTMTGVFFVGPDMLVGATAGACDTNSTVVGPIPGAGPTGWLQANGVGRGSAPASANDVVIGIIDEFANAGQPARPDNAQHGDVVAAYAQDAGGRTASGTPLFELGRNLFEIPREPTIALTLARMEAFIAANPGKKIVMNYSAGPVQCQTRRAGYDPAVCTSTRNQFNKLLNSAMQRSVATHGDRVI